MDVITTHLHADCDGLAAMVAARKLYPGAALVFPGGAQETVRNFLAVSDLGLTRLKDLKLEEVTRLILVDTQEPERLGPLRPLCTNPAVAIHIFDHHPEVEGEASQRICQANLKAVEPVGATTTVVIERVLQQGLTFSPLEATTLALGLYDETGSFTYVSTTPRDLQAAAVVLHAGADLTVVADMLRQPLDPDAIVLLNDLLSHSTTYYLEGCTVLLATSTDDRYRGELADVAHRLAELKGIDAVIAAFAMDDKIELIGRSRRPGIDVAQIVAAFGGGGHPGAAAATVKDRTMVEVRETLEHLLTARYHSTLLAKDVMTTPVQTIAEDTTIAETVQRMITSGVTVLPVVDGQTYYRGVLAREVVQHALVQGLASSPVQMCLQTALYTATPDTPCRDIARQMTARHQRYVPILTGAPPAQHVVGVITRADLLRTVHEEVLAAARLRGKGPPFPEALPLVRRPVQGLLRARLPHLLYARLERIGRCADVQGVSAYIVGDWVRDLLLGIHPPDMDVVIEGDGMAFVQTLAQREGVRVTTHARHRIAVLQFPEGDRITVAPARTAADGPPATASAEGAQFNGRPSPTALPTEEQRALKYELARRDFTINTLAIRLNTQHFGELLDFYGGQRDLKDKTLRVLHGRSFVDDPTRAWRAIRYEVRYGLHMAKETLRLLKGAVRLDLFHRLSDARLGEEIRLLLGESAARQAVACLAELELLRFLHPTVTWSSRLDRVLQAIDEVLAWYRLASLHWPGHTAEPGSPGVRPRAAIEPWLVRFMALVDALPDVAVHEMLRRLSLSRRHSDTVRAARAACHAIPRLATRPPLRPAETYRLLAGQRLETILFVLAKTSSAVAQQQIVAYLDTYRWMKPQLSGHDLQALGLTPGPLFRQVLNRLLEARLNSEVTTDTEERALVQQLRSDASARRLQSGNVKNLT
jgi:tRNA nucleotidyltransferase (CCA-adding enzyme)